MNDFSELPKWLRRPKDDDIFPVFSIVAKVFGVIFAGAFILHAIYSFL